MSYLKGFVIFVSLLMSTSVLLAQKGTVKGVVTDEDTNDPIPFLNVYPEDKSTLATTNFDGEYELKLDAGTYVLIFSSLEYGKTKKTVTVSAGGTVTVNMSLTPADVKMETILVKTDKYAKPIEEITTSMNVIEPSIIENKAVTDVTDALEQAPGLTIVDNEPQMRAGSGYSFGAGSRVMVLVDDMPLLTGDAGRPSWGFIPVENIEQIEVIKGASSVLYGSAALNGVINVRTAYPKSEPQTKINFKAGVYDKPKRDTAKWWEENMPFFTGINFFHSRRASDNFAFVVGGNIYVENGFVGPEPTSVGDELPGKIAFWNAIRDKDNMIDTVTFGGMDYREITQAQYNDSVKVYADKYSKELKKPSFNNRIRFNFNTRYKAKKIKGLSAGINGNIMYSRSANSLIWLNNYDGLYRAFPGARTTTKQTTFNLDPYVEHYDQRGNKYSLKTRVFYQNNNNDNDQANKNTVFYGEFRYLKTLQKVRDFTISAGLMGNHTIGESELFAGGELDSLVAEGKQAKRSATNAAVYVQLDKKLWDRVNLTLGGRWEYFNIDGDADNQPVFRAGVSVKAHKETYIRASFGQGFRFPTISERFIETTIGGVPIIPNPNLGAELSWSAEVGIKQGIKIKKFLGYLDIAGFTQYYKDYVEFIAAQWNEPDFTNPDLSTIEKFGLAFRSVNTTNTRVSGVEVSLMGQGNFTDDVGLNVLMGYTFARPVSLQPHKAFGQDASGNDLTYINSSTDTTNNILKYRYEHTAKADVEFFYKNLSVGASFKAYSFMQNVDAIFYSTAIELLGIKAREYRENNDGPEFVVDFRIAYDISDQSKIAFIINNALNREYALRPLVINAPRNYTIQYTLDLKGKKKS